MLGPNVKMQLGIAEPANPRPLPQRVASRPSELLSSWPAMHHAAQSYTPTAGCSLPAGCAQDQDWQPCPCHHHHRLHSSILLL